MPKEARVFIVEDDEYWINRVTQVLLDDGHSVVAKAGTLNEAIATIPMLQSYGVEVTILDANLSSWESSGDDGKRILRLIREQHPHIKVVGMSAGSLQGVDVDVGKGSVANLGKVVRRL